MPSSLDLVAAKNLCVDLDGTLIREDSFYHRLLQFHFLRPGGLLPVIFFSGLSRAAAKAALSRASTFPATKYTYNKTVLELIYDYRKCGASIWLVTATDRATAKQVTELLGCFDGFYSSCGYSNLAGRKKADRLVAAFGTKAFDYVGNSVSDLEAWKVSNIAYFVGKNKKAWRMLNLVKPECKRIA